MASTSLVESRDPHASPHALVRARRADTDALGETMAALAARLHAATYDLLVLRHEFDERTGWNNGFLSCAHWLHWRTGIDLGAAREQVRVAKALPALPRVSAAMQRGQISYAMELVEGDDLSQRIARGAIPIDEALPAAKQIAEALEAAHEKGIIHRDLKPANIKVRADGTVKVLDFGLAKAMDPPVDSSLRVSQSPTITTPAMTQAGMILGTAAYMAPEQARGKAVDKRADMGAFGAVLFEMLTGTRAFPSEDLTDTLAAVVRAEPNWTLLPAGLPSALAVYLKRCLQKGPKQRIPDIAAMRLALEGAFETAAPSTAAQTTRAFSGDSGVETLNAILKSEPAEFETRGVPVPVEVARIVAHGLEKHPADRFQSARDLAFHLAGAAGSAGDALRKAQAPDDAAAGRRRRGWALPVGVVAAALAGAPDGRRFLAIEGPPSSGAQVLVVRHGLQRLLVATRQVGLGAIGAGGAAIRQDGRALAAM